MICKQSHYTHAHALTQTAVSILFGCQTWVIQGTTETFWSVAVAASEGQGFAIIALVGRCRGLRKPGFDGCSLDLDRCLLYC